MICPEGGASVLRRERGCLITFQLFRDDEELFVVRFTSKTRKARRPSLGFGDGWLRDVEET